MSNSDKTLNEDKTPIDLLFDGLASLHADTKLALKESREANIMSGANNELLKKLVVESPLSRAVPYAALFLALVALLRAW